MYTRLIIRYCQLSTQSQTVEPDRCKPGHYRYKQYAQDH